MSCGRKNGSFVGRYWKCAIIQSSSSATGGWNYMIDPSLSGYCELAIFSKCRAFVGSRVGWCVEVDVGACCLH